MVTFSLLIMINEFPAQTGMVSSGKKHLEIEVVDDDEDSGRYPAIHVDESKTVHITYFMQNTNDNTSALKYAVSRPLEAEAHLGISNHRFPEA